MRRDTSILERLEMLALLPRPSSALCAQPFTVFTLTTKLC
jgi:hypothetical protein